MTQKTFDNPYNHPIDYMEKYFKRFAKTHFIVLFIILFLATNIGFTLIFEPLEAKALDITFFYTSEKAYEIIESYGQTGREIYIQGTLLLDFIYPIIYSILLSLLLYKASGNHITSLLPFSILILDYFENITLLTIIYNYPARMDSLATTAGIITTLKWVIVAITILVITYFGMKNTLQKKRFK